MDKACAINYPRYLCQGWNEHVRRNSDSSQLKRVQIVFVNDWLREHDLTRVPPHVIPEDAISITCKNAAKDRRNELKRYQDLQGGQLQWYSVYVTGTLFLVWLLPLR